MKQFAVFTTPPDATVELRPDGHPVLTPVAGTIDGRLAWVFAIPDTVHDGWGASLVVASPGQVTSEQKGVLWLTGTHGPRAELVIDDVHLSRGPSGSAGRPSSPAPVTASLVARGLYFGLATGEAFTAIEASDFNLLARYARVEAISPLLAQRAACGFNLLRVWTLFDIPGIGTLHDCPYDLIPAFVAYCARYGCYVEFTAYTGINDPAHWSRLVAAAGQCTPRPLLELVNELDQNTNEPDGQGRVFDLSLHAQPPAPLLSCHGSNGSQAAPVVPHWSYAAMHFNDAPEWPRKVGHNSMEIWDGPTLAGENTRAIDRFNATHAAFDAAAGAALLCAGSCFHSQRGKTSELWDGDELACAQAWADGARSVPLEFQDGRYVHDATLEGPDDLRVYQRVLGDGRAWTVRIRR